MGYDFLYSVNDGVATLTFNRPEVMNALTFEVYAQLRDLFETLRYDEAVRVVVLTGAGDNFCSGGDVHQIIGELLKRDMKGHLEFTRMTGAVVQNMRLLDKPIMLFGRHPECDITIDSRKISRRHCCVAAPISTSWRRAGRRSASLVRRSYRCTR